MKAWGKIFLVFTVGLLGLILFFSFYNRSSTRDNSTLVVQPGFGITNLCSWGMTYKQVRAANLTRSSSTPVGGRGSASIPWHKELASYSFPPWARARVLIRIRPTLACGLTSSRTAFIKFPFRGKFGERLSSKTVPFPEHKSRRLLVSLRSSQRTALTKRYVSPYKPGVISLITRIEDSSSNSPATLWTAVMLLSPVLTGESSGHYRQLQTGRATWPRITISARWNMTYSQIQATTRDAALVTPGLWALKRVNPSRGGEHLFSFDPWPHKRS